MSNTEIILEYSDPTADTGKKIMLSTSPLWGILAPLAAVVCVPATGFAPICCFYVFGLFLITAGCLGATIAFADNRIIISKRGLRVPPLLTLFALGRDEIPWTSISSLAVEEDRNFDPTEAQSLITKQLVLKLKDKDTISLRLHQLKKEQVEQLVLSLSLWLDEKVTLPLLEIKEAAGAGGNRIEDKRRKKDGEPDSPSDLTFTQLWQSELQSRYTATAFMPLEPDQTIRDGTLKIIRQISFGGLSAVYLCQQDQKELRVLKESVVPLNNRASLRDKAREMFQREAAILLKVEHEQIARVVDFFTEEERTYLLLAHIEGVNLRQLVREAQTLPEEKVLSIAASLLSPLHYLHELTPPVVHRDISPENIILEEEDRAVLIDFGAANEFLGTATGTLVGKQCYISPEQFKGKACTASDLYSLGATLYFLLTGDDPTPISSSSPRLKRPEISEATDALVRDLTALEIEERIKTVDELEARLKPLLAAGVGNLP